MKKITLITLLFISVALQAQCWSSYDSGIGYTISLKSDGSLWAWGYNFYGQLGVGNNVDQYFITRVGTDSNWESVEAGETDTFAIKSDGTLWGWGRNQYGQLGIGNNDQSFVPVQVGTETNWKSVSNHGFHTLALKTDNTLWGWGQEDFVNGFINSMVPLQIGTDTWKTISTGQHYVMGIKTDGTLWAWGTNEYGVFGNGTTIGETSGPIQIGTENQWDSISAFTDHTMAIKLDGSLWGWGGNYYGQLGDGTVTDRLVPTRIGTGNNWQSVTAGYRTTHAIRTDGTLWASGFNSSGQLGDGTTLNRVTQVQIGTSANWKLLKPNYSYCQVGLQNNGKLYGWGSNQWGQTSGDGNNFQHNSPTLINCPALAVNSILSKELITFFPNPTKDIVHITSKGNITSVQLVDVQGRVLETMTANDEAIDFDLSQKNSGVYFVKIYTVKGVKVEKIIKE
ncbi:MAG: T9SS type A sorting domain-containing protein [Flavobacterium sp.]|nr:T9SS type A sorting domain-containing protein [Flavobacterium sp.]